VDLVRQGSSGHWYTKEGESAHVIVGKNGKERPTTVRDARALGLVPSVTTITQVLANPSLEAWKSEQLVLAAMTLPRIEGEKASDYAKRVIEDSRAQSKEAAAKGTDVHGAIASYCQEGIIRVLGMEFLFNELEKYTLQGDFEKRFASTLGYAGTIDFIGHLSNKSDVKEEAAIIDFKTQGTREGKYRVYDSWKYQLCAYRQAAIDLKLIPPDVTVYNMIISTTEDQVWLYKFTEEDITIGTEVFNHLKNVFYLTKGLPRSWIS
jgi:hypothetical protein